MKFKKRNAFPYCCSIEFKDKSLTQQQFKDECDVVKQIERLSVRINTTGESLADINNQGAMYGDFSEVPDFAAYNQIVCDAKEKFDALDPKIKSRFNNSPEQLFSFILDENNRDEAQKLGLLQPVIQDIKENIQFTQNDIKSPENGSSDGSDTAI